VHSKYLRQNAVANAQYELALRNTNSKEQAEHLQSNVKTFYFYTTTILPDQPYFSYFQFRFSSKIEKALERLIIQITVEDEIYEFQARIEKKK